MFRLLIIIILLVSGECLTMPLTNPDGSANLASITTHITMLEQTIQSKDTTADVAVLKSQLTTALADLKETQLKLASATATFQVEIADLRSQCSCSLPSGNQQLVNISSLKSDVSGLKSDVSSLKSDVSSLKSDSTKMKAGGLQLQTQGNATGGALYTRWGRTKCPADTKIVYKGYTGGTYYANTAASSTILCLPDDPIYGNYTNSSTTYVAGVWGTEYQTGYTGNPFESLVNENMPCVVCESETRRSVVMVPARNQCHPGWNLEYWGYLMGGANNYASAEYVCVDEDPEMIPGGQYNKEGQRLYVAESKCGSLSCPPYVNGWQLTCAVCSK